MADSSSSAVAEKLLAHRHVFKSFVASRVGNTADAEDLLQNGLVKALHRAGEVKDDEKAIAWFFRLLRNVIIDHVRSRAAAEKREEAWAVDAVTLRDDEEAERQIARASRKCCRR